jgi:hypothetical protein
VPGLLMRLSIMPSYEFSVIIASGKLSHDKILDATDALGESGCTDRSLCGHAEGMELQFNRFGRSLQTAISSAIKDVERAGFKVLRVEMEREAIPK